MPKHRTTPQANELLMRGALALSEIEHNGVRIDKEYLDKTIKDIAQKVKDADSEVESDPDFIVWRKRYGVRTKVSAPDQIAKVVFGDLGFKSTVRTDSGDRESAAKAALEQVKIPLTEKYLRAAKLRKLHGTYLKGIQREAVQHSDGNFYVHPSYQLNRVVSFRSGCAAPNWQNIYKREPEFAEIMRRNYVPRKGHLIVEIDYGSAEVKMAVNYTEDPVAFRECTEPGADAHRDAACKLFFLQPYEVEKTVRFFAKNMFTFAQFYGDYYINCAKNLWPAIAELKVKDSEETVRERLAKNGVRELGLCDPSEKPQSGTFEKHVQSVESWYWNDKYKVHTKWKEDWWGNYQVDGGVMLKTGFAINGVYTKNQIINYPIQGSSFHQLLWALPRINEKLRRFKMKSRVIGEIHDAVQLDAHPSERDDVIDICRQCMVTDLAKEWSWMIVRPEIEPECAPIDRSWNELVKLKESKDGYVPEDLTKFEKKYGPWSDQCNAS